MAGAGYKLFTTGSVLTAAEVNTYLNEQTVMVFNNAAARTTALSGVVSEGMISYLKDTNAVEVYDGAAWVGVSNVGDITSVTAGTGLTGGGTSGAVTVSLASPVAATLGGTGQVTYTTGDLIYSSATDTLAKRAIGTTGQVLTVSGGVPTWTTPTGSNSNWSLLNAGGTALTGAATITISGISGRESILVLFKLASSVNAGSKINVRINGDTAGNYYYSQNSFSVNTSYTPTVIEGIFRDGDNFVRLGTMPDIATGQVNGHLLIQGCNTSGVKVFQGAGAGSAGTNNAQAQSVVGGYYNSTSTVSSISLFSDFGNFDNGTVYVYATN